MSRSSGAGIGGLERLCSYLLFNGLRHSTLKRPCGSRFCRITRITPAPRHLHLFPAFTGTLGLLPPQESGTLADRTRSRSAFSAVWKGAVDVETPPMQTIRFPRSTPVWRGTSPSRASHAPAAQSRSRSVTSRCTAGRGGRAPHPVADVARLAAPDLK